MMDLAKKQTHQKIRLVEINPHLTCCLCKGYYVDATTISECLHSFCRSCIIRFLHKHSYCPICEVIINKAKPNLKLDKTLQDIVYKLVPELFLSEMKRRQRFYQNHPELATKVTPEERGEDTERTIFNPRDTISLSIEYISDDSTPGAILIPQLTGNEADINNKTKSQTAADNDENSSIKRFLQCPAMCRVEVLKKFIQNKYNVDTNQYYIDILYKRVPLPDHYTLIDIAYIYSWKRNEPMTFFFKITDIKLVTDNFDYLIRPQISESLKSDKKTLKNSSKPETNHEVVKTQKKPHTPVKEAEEPKSELPANENNKLALAKNDKNKEYTNITLDRKNNVEIITKIQKVSNKDGLQIGIKITKQTVKKPSKTSENKSPSEEKSNKPVEIPFVKPNSPENIPEVDPEKSNFLKSIELTAKNVLQAMSPQKLPSPKAEPKGTKRKNASPLKAEKPPKKPKKLVNIQPKSASVQNPAVWQMMSNVNQNVSSMSKIVEQMTPSNNSDLQALLYDSYKINIPASLSVTVKNEKDGPTSSPFQKPVQNYIEILKIPDRPATPAKTCDSKEREKLLDRLNASVEVSKIEVKLEEPKSEPNQELKSEMVELEPSEIKVEKSPSATKPVNLHQPPKNAKNALLPKTTSAYLPCKVTNMPTKDNFVKLNPRTPQTFQKMFEEAVKKSEFNSKFQVVSSSKTEPAPVSNKPAQKTALNLTSPDTPATGKRNILEIASKLYKRTKMEQEGKAEVKSKSEPPSKALSKPLNVPRLSQPRKTKFQTKGNPPLKDFNSYISSKPPQPPQTVASLHSPTLGLNYSVSVTQASPNSTPKTPNNSDSSKQTFEIETPKKSILSPPKAESTPLNVPQKHSGSSKFKTISPKLAPKEISPVVKTMSPKKSDASPNGAKPNSNVVSSSQGENNQPLSPNQILEKYNIQNLAQLTANFNFPPNLCMSPANQLAAMHQALIYRHFEMQNHQNWLNMNPNPLMQYEKYLQSLSKS